MLLQAWEIDGVHRYMCHLVYAVRCSPIFKWLMLLQAWEIDGVHRYMCHLVYAGIIHQLCNKTFGLPSLLAMDPSALKQIKKARDEAVRKMFVSMRSHHVAPPKPALASPTANPAVSASLHGSSKKVAVKPSKVTAPPTRVPGVVATSLPSPVYSWSRQPASSQPQADRPAPPVLVDPVAPGSLLASVEVTEEPGRLATVSQLEVSRKRKASVINNVTSLRQSDPEPSEVAIAEVRAPAEGNLPTIAKVAEEPAADTVALGVNPSFNFGSSSADDREMVHIRLSSLEAEVNELRRLWAQHFPSDNQGKLPIMPVEAVHEPLPAVDVPGPSCPVATTEIVQDSKVFLSTRTVDEILLRSTENLGAGLYGAQSAALNEIRADIVAAAASIRQACGEISRRGEPKTSAGMRPPSAPRLPPGALFGLLGPMTS